jgi:hypothetical protein
MQMEIVYFVFVQYVNLRILYGGNESSSDLSPLIGEAVITQTDCTDFNRVRDFNEYIFSV